MAIRLRKIKGITTALCAAKSSPLKGDHYINDGEHEALGTKFEKDFRSMGFLKEEYFIPNEPKTVRDNETKYGSCKGCKYYPRHLLRTVCAECDDWENYELIQ